MRPVKELAILRCVARANIILVLHGAFVARCVKHLERRTGRIRSVRAKHACQRTGPAVPNWMLLFPRYALEFSYNNGIDYVYFCLVAICGARL